MDGTALYEAVAAIYIAQLTKPEVASDIGKICVIRYDDNMAIW